MSIKPDVASKPAITHIIGYYPPHLGGSEKVAEALSEMLAARGYGVRVLTSDAGSHDSRQIKKSPSSLDVRRLKSFEFAHTPFMPALLFQLLRLPRRTGVLHLHIAQAYYPELVWLTSKIRRMPYIAHFHLDVQPSGRFGKLYVVYKATVLKFVIAHATRVVVFSEEQKLLIIDKFGVSADKIAIIPNGVGDEYFMPVKRDYRKSAHNLLYVGRLSPQKRVHILIEALAQMNSNVTLTIVGDGETYGELKALVGRLRLTNVRFEGRKDASELRQYLREADAFIVASEVEGMPLSVLEAMAAGLPVIAARVPGLTELVRNVGIVVDNPSGSTFAKTLDELLPQSQEMVRLSSQSSAAAINYTWDRVTDSIEALYREVAQ